MCTSILIITSSIQICTYVYSVTYKIFALYVEVAVGKTDIPYGNLQNLGCHVIGMPLGIPFHNPLLYTEQQLNQILTNLDKIVFLRVQQDGRVSVIGLRFNFQYLRLFTIYSFLCNDISDIIPESWHTVLYCMNRLVSCCSLKI